LRFARLVQVCDARIVVIAASPAARTQGDREMTATQTITQLFAAQAAVVAAPDDRACALAATKRSTILAKLTRTQRRDVEIVAASILAVLDNTKPRRQRVQH
jgi:nucleotidyltransferase/DNA polymerase involved in DNA repair